jgi:orotidine-5'-phosphate decarboxylase
MTFTKKLATLQEKKRSLLCIGLDPDLSRMPAPLHGIPSTVDLLVRFCQAMVAATAEYACAFKLNFAFFEAHGLAGWEALHRVRALLPDDTLAIADAKRGDIGHSAQFYARSVFEDLGFDACTVSPYMGRDSVEPFLAYPGTAAFVLARTSNPGGADLQELDIAGRKLYEHTARLAASWAKDQRGEVGLVVGATHAEPVRLIRTACPSIPFLVPGVGAQGGDPAEILDAAGHAYGLNLINSSRQILYASAGRDFAEAAGREAAALRDTLSVHRPR